MSTLPSASIHVSVSIPEAIDAEPETCRFVVMIESEKASGPTLARLFQLLSTTNCGIRMVDKYDRTQQEFVSDYTLIASRMYSGITPYCRIFCSASQHASVAQRMHTRCTTRARLRAVTDHISASTCISWRAVSQASALPTAGAGAVIGKRDLNGVCGRTQKAGARTLSEKSWFVGPRFQPGPRRSAESLRGPGAARRRRLAPPGAPPCRFPAPGRPPAG
jgi:hypothetical protein